MANKKYLRQANDEIVEFEGKVYCAKRPWVIKEDSGEIVLLRAVEEGIEAEDDGMFPAVELSVEKKEEGSWEVFEVFGPEQYMQDGGIYGMLLWNERRGFMINLFNHITYE
jgi:hypothetical protein